MVSSTTAPRLLGSLLTAAVLATALTVEARGAGWTNARNVSDGTLSHSLHDVGSDTRGSMTALRVLHEGSTSTLQAMVRDAATLRWGTPQTLASGSPRGSKLAVAPNGDALAAWIEDGNPASVVKASLRVGSRGTWTPAAEVSDPYRITNPVDSLAVAIDGSGSAVVVFVSAAYSGAVWAADLRPGRTVWHMKNVSREWTPKSHAPVDVVIGAGGTAVAVWERDLYGETSIGAATLPIAAYDWSEPQLVSVGDGEASNPSVAGWSGSAYAAWVRKTPAALEHRVQVAELPTGAPWQAPQDVSSRGSSVDRPVIMFAGDGTGVLAWSRTHDIYRHVEASIRPLGATPWSQPQTLAAGNESRYPEVASDVHGNIVAAWRTGLGAVGVAVRRKDADWAGSHQFLVPGVGQPYVGTHPSGNAVVLWSRLTDRFVIQEALYDATPPTFEEISVPSQARAKVSITFSAPAFDLWSGLEGSPVWSFGDGLRPLTGRTVGYIYDRAGTYVGSVRQRDRVGNEVSAQWSIVVGPPAAPRPAVYCRVPRVVGLRLAKASLRIRRANCLVGRVRKVPSRKVGKVLAQNPRAGLRKPRRFKVKLVLGRRR